MAGPGKPARASGLAAALLDRGFMLTVGVAAASGLACYLWRGEAVFWEALHDDALLIAFVLPVAVGSIFLSAFLRVLVPEAMVRRWLGAGSGWTGLAIGTALGMLVPGGPMTSFPLIAALMVAGADVGVTLAFLTSWSVLGLSRIIAWEYPLLGADFVAIRFLASCPLPFLAGWLARRLPIHVAPPGRP